MSGGEQIGDQQRNAGLSKARRVGQHAAHAVGDVVAGGVRHRARDGVGVVVHRENLADPEPRGRDRQDARSGADVEHPHGPVTVDDRFERFQAAGGGSVMTGPERAPGLDRDHDPSVRVRLVPGRDDQESAPDGPGREVGAPGVGPVFVGERRDVKVARGREAQLGEPVEVSPHALLERARRDRLGKEGAKRGAAARPLLLDDAEGAELPREVGQPFGEIAGHADGELPVAGDARRRPPRGWGPAGRGATINRG